MRKKVLFLGIVTALLVASLSVGAMAATKAGSPCKKLKLISISMERFTPASKVARNLYGIKVR
jgi:hypothetical protein